MSLFLRPTHSAWKGIGWNLQGRVGRHPREVIERSRGCVTSRRKRACVCSQPPSRGAGVPDTGPSLYVLTKCMVGEK